MTKKWTSLRRMPIKEAIEVLRASAETHKLAPTVSALSLTFRQGFDSRVEREVNRNEPGKFLRSVAPRIAYANPNLPINVTRIPTPFNPAKETDANKYKLNVDPRSEEEKAKLVDAVNMKPSITISFHNRPDETIELSTLSSEDIWERVRAIAGAEPSASVEAPKAEAAQPAAAQA